LTTNFFDPQHRENDAMVANCKNVIAILSTVVFVVLVVVSANAQTIVSVNLDRQTTADPDANTDRIPTASSIGVVSAENWNNVNVDNPNPPGGSSYSGLLDSNGATVAGLNFSITGGGGDTWNTGGHIPARMMGDWVRGIKSFTISDIPDNTRVTLITYHGGFNDSDDKGPENIVRVTANSISRTYDDSNWDNNEFDNATTWDYTENENYLRWDFVGNTDQITVKFAAKSTHNRALNAFQLVISDHIEAPRSFASENLRMEKWDEIVGPEVHKPNYQKQRTWTSPDGQHRMKGALETVEDGKVTIKSIDTSAGIKTVRKKIAYDKTSTDDLDFILEMIAYDGFRDPLFSEIPSLVEAGANINLKLSAGLPGVEELNLLWAFPLADESNEALKKLDVLLELGADPNSLNKGHHPLLAVAVVKNKPRLSLLLISHGATLSEEQRIRADNVLQLRLKQPPAEGSLPK
jgi:hypothetical protein